MSKTLKLVAVAVAATLTLAACSAHSDTGSKTTSRPSTRN